MHFFFCCWQTGEVLWFFSTQFKKVRWKKVKYNKQQSHALPLLWHDTVSSNHVTGQCAFVRWDFSFVPELPVSWMLISMVLMSMLAAVWIDSTPESLKKNTEHLFSFASPCHVTALCALMSEEERTTLQTMIMIRARQFTPLFGPFSCESRGEFQTPSLPHSLNYSSRSAAGQVIHSAPMFDYKPKD